MSPPGVRRGTWEWPFFTALLVAVVWAACFYYPVVWIITGIGEADKPFLDLRNILAAIETARLGIDPYLKNPFDPYNRPHAYSDWWLIGGRFGLGLKDALWLGLLLAGATLTSAVVLIRPATRRESLGLFLVLISPPLLFAINRANHDIVVFVLMGAALAGFRSTRKSFQFVAVVLLAVAAALKYFPLAAGALLLEARTRRELLGWCLLYGAVLVLAWPSLEAGLRVAVSHQPAPAWLYAFGAPVVFRDFELGAPGLWLIAALLGATALASWPALKATSATPASGATRDQEREFACGAVMVVSCFAHGSTYIYKMVFAVWLLPWLWRTTLSGSAERWRKVTLALLFAVLWLEGGVAVIINLLHSALLLPLAAGERILQADLLLSQLLTYALVICLWRELLSYLVRQLKRLALPAKTFVPA